MAGMEFPIARTTASVRESANWGDQELGAVLVTRLSDVAVDGRESLVGRPADKLLLVERDVRGITRDNQKVSSRGRTTEGNARNNGNENHFDQKKLFTEPRENAMLLELKAKPTKIRQNQEKPYATRTPRHSTLTKLRVQRKHSVGTWPAHAPKRHTAGQESAPPCSRTMINATNANIVTQQRYRRPTRHQRTPKTLETIAPSR